MDTGCVLVIALSLITFPIAVISAKAIHPSPPPLPDRVRQALLAIRSTRNAPALERVAGFWMAARIFSPNRVALRVVAAHSTLCLAGIAATCAPTETYDLIIYLFDAIPEAVRRLKGESG